MADDTTTDPELVRLLDIIEQGYYEAGRFVRKGRLGSDGFARAIGAHAALLAHIAAHYVRRDAYTAARGTLHLDDDGNVAGGAPDFEGER